MEKTDRFYFDEALLPEDNWEGVMEECKVEGEKIVDVRSGQKTRYGRIYRQFQVYWKVYIDPTWVNETDLKCGALLQVFKSNQASQRGSR